MYSIWQVTAPEWNGQWVQRCIIFLQRVTALSNRSWSYPSGSAFTRQNKIATHNRATCLWVPEQGVHAPGKGLVPLVEIGMVGWIVTAVLMEMGVMSVFGAFNVDGAD